LLKRLWRNGHEMEDPGHHRDRRRDGDQLLRLRGDLIRNNRY
jgi:hypothetical protein